MNEKAQKALAAMNRERLEELVREIHGVLWPTHDPDHEWSADTPEDIANVFADSGLGSD